MNESVERAVSGMEQAYKEHSPFSFIYRGAGVINQLRSMQNLNAISAAEAEALLTRAFAPGRGDPAVWKEWWDFIKPATQGESKERIDKRGRVEVGLTVAKFIGIADENGIPSVKPVLELLAEKYGLASQPASLPAIERIKVSPHTRERADKESTLYFVGAEGRKIIGREGGQGVLSQVYMGRYEGQEKDSLVVKVAKEWEEHLERVSIGTRNTFDLEVRVLQEMENRGCTHTPKVHYYHPGSGIKDLPYIVMDLAKGIKLDDGHTTFYRLGDKIVGHGYEEETAIEIAYQFAETEAIAQDAGYFNADIKSGYWSNLYWDSQNHNLTVIDWNVIRDVNKAPAEYRTWGIERIYNLLYFLLIGKPPRDLPLEEQPEWEVLRQICNPQTQAILRKGFGKQYQEIPQLLDELKRALAYPGVMNVETQVTPEPPILPNPYAILRPVNIAIPSITDLPPEEQERAKEPTAPPEPPPTPTLIGLEDLDKVAPEPAAPAQLSGVEEAMQQIRVEVTEQSQRAEEARDQQTRRIFRLPNLFNRNPSPEQLTAMEEERLAKIEARTTELMNKEGLSEDEAIKQATTEAKQKNA